MDKEDDIMNNSNLENINIVNNTNSEIIDHHDDDHHDDTDDSNSENNYTLQEFENEYIIGIDLGTTNSCVAIWRNENLEIIPDEYGNRTIPSYVAFTNVNRYVGLDAKNQKELNPNNVFYEVKRLIGRKFDDPFVAREKEYLSYNIESDDNKNILLVPELGNSKKFTPEEIASAILSKAKLMATNYLGKKISKCVITIPANFNDGQRQATKDAATIAGLECIRLINEPTSAALAYGLLRRSKSDGEKKIIVYDFGGGTLDVSLLSIEDGIFTVLASGGNTRMGGSDFDNRLISFCMGKFEKQNNIKLDSLSNMSLQKLRLSCEQAKKILSTSLKTQVAVKNFFNDIDLFVRITRTDFEKICMDLFLICLKPIDDILKPCDLHFDDIDEIILVGGMTRMPKIRELLKLKFGRDANCSINPEEAVAAGAAIQGFLISHTQDAFSESVTVLDATSLSLGVETIGGVMNIIIERGSIIPASESKMYSTDSDYVDSVNIKIYEGERTLTKDNFFVGEFELTGIEPQPRGMAEIEVLFNVDTNGIIVVTAENTKTNDKSTISVTSNKGRLTKEKIEELIEEARELEIRDELERRKKMLYYGIDDFCSNISINIKNKELKLSDIDREIIFDDISKVLNWLKEKKYNDREEEEYEQVLNNIKKQYGVLILKGSMDDGTVKNIDASDNPNMTTVYGGDNDEDEQNIKQVFENIEEVEGGYKGLSDPEKAEMKELRKAVTDLCYSIFDMISSRNLKLSKEHTTELKDYIDDSLLWLYVHENPTKIEYKMKIDEIDNRCNTVFEEYTKDNGELFIHNEIVEANKNSRDELENMCLVFKLLIFDNAFPINKKLLSDFENKLNETLEFIYIEDDKSNTDELKKIYLDSCTEKINYINSLSETIQQKMQGINLNDKKDILGGDRIILSGYTEEHNIVFEGNQINDNEDNGIDIITIMRERQKNIIDDMINDDCDGNSGDNSDEIINDDNSDHIVNDDIVNDYNNVIVLVNNKDIVNNLNDDDNDDNDDIYNNSDSDDGSSEISGNSDVISKSSNDDDDSDSDDIISYSENENDDDNNINYNDNENINDINIIDIDIII
jgi:heat shock protein 1/8